MGRGGQGEAQGEDVGILRFIGGRGLELSQDSGNPCELKTFQMRRDSKGCGISGKDHKAEWTWNMSLIRKANGRLSV